MRDLRTERSAKRRADRLGSNGGTDHPTTLAQSNPVPNPNPDARALDQRPDGVANDQRPDDSTNDQQSDASTKPGADTGADTGTVGTPELQPHRRPDGRPNVYTDGDADLKPPDIGPDSAADAASIQSAVEPLPSRVR
jgi:hypothetical protein